MREPEFGEEISRETPPVKRSRPTEIPCWEEEYDPYLGEKFLPEASEEIDEEAEVPEGVGEDWYWREPDYWLEEMWLWPPEVPKTRPKSINDIEP
ncbi:MAG TPA: hypothetical protein GXX30_04185 [Firmicutes bacterium]|nr:hypothetical protein [Candidatus Fermentithermobacillaceae bacterium]